MTDREPGGSLAEALRRGVVLYVDDEVANRVVFQATFSEFFDVACVGSGAEALDYLAAHPVDVLVSDHRMPGMTGVELCERVRRTHPDVQRILVTAYTDLDTATDAINRGGVSRYVQKPWRKEDLRTILDNALSEAVLRRTVRLLQSTMVTKERLAGVAAARGRILHDLANVSLVVSVTNGNIVETLKRWRDRLPDELYAELSEELRDQQQAVRHLEELHERVRSIGSGTRAARGVHQVREVLRSALVLARGQIDGRVAVEIDCPEALVVYADPTDLARIVVNLVTNAAQALVEAGTPEPRVAISAWREGDEVIVRVSDNGPGVPPEVRDRIFEVFFTTRGDSGGSGLGLAICAELARENGGGITLEAAAPGGGASFRVNLPAIVPGGR